MTHVRHTGVDELIRWQHHGIAIATRGLLLPYGLTINGARRRDLLYGPCTVWARCHIAGLIRAVARRAIPP